MLDFLAFFDVGAKRAAQSRFCLMAVAAGWSIAKSR